MSLRGWLCVLVSLVLTPIAVYAIVFAVGRFLSAPSRSVIQVPETLSAEPILFKSDSGAQIHGSWISGSPNAPVVILMHGVRADRRALFRRADFFKKRGYSVLLFDFQAHGESEGDQITFGHLESLDANAAFNFVKAKRPGVRIGIVALSMGGAAALMGDASIEAKALVLEAVYPDIRAATDNRIRRWLGPMSQYLTPIFMQTMAWQLNIKESELSPVDRITKFKNPVLILSGSKDVHTTASDTQRLFVAANEPKQLVFFEGARHQDLYEYDTAKYENLLESFFKNSLEN